MTTKVISFLGYTRPGSEYRPTTYVFQEMESTPFEYTTPFMTEAAARFFRPDELLVLVTSEAKKQNFKDLQSNLQGFIDPKPVDIPSGKRENELWEMFDSIASCIEQHDTIIFDITNGFRSLPVLAFLAASYVRLVRGATVKQMVYGAFDAKDEERNRTPVFDLTPFLVLLEWTTATSAFLKSGQADELSNLLRSGISSSIPKPDVERLADRLETLSLALHTSRSTRIMEAASGLDDDVSRSKSGISGNKMPITLLLDKINTEYSVFGLAEPMDIRNSRQVIERLAKVIRWYVDKNLLIHAITLAREWIVSLVVYYLKGDLFDKEDRNKAEGVLNRKVKRPENADLSMRLSDIMKIWSEVEPDDLQARDLRNDIAHCGMRRDHREPQKVVEGVRAICDALEKLIPS